MISRIFTWYLMLKKRLLKKIGFMIILIIIPIFAYIFHLGSQDGGGGFVRIALAVEDANDEIAVEMMESVGKDSKVFEFVICDSPKEAKRQVEASKADAAWVFADDMKKELEAAGARKRATLVHIYESEESTFLMVSREKIFAVLYPHVAYYIYDEFITNEMLPDKDVSEELLKECYDVVEEQEGFIEFQFLDSDQGNIEDVDYITSTIRGLLVVLMLLAGMASTMYFLKDEEKGIYSWIPIKRRIFILWGNNLAALSMSGVFVTLALVIGGTYTTFWRETISMFLFILMATAFCSVLGVLFTTIKSFCILLPTILVAGIAFCPIFFNTRIPLQQILPPYFYLFSINNVKTILWMILYCVVAYPMGCFLNLRKK